MNSTLDFIAKHLKAMTFLCSLSLSVNVSLVRKHYVRNVTQLWESDQFNKGGLRVVWKINSLPSLPRTSTGSDDARRLFRVSLAIDLRERDVIDIGQDVLTWKVVVFWGTVIFTWSKGRGKFCSQIFENLHEILYFFLSLPLPDCTVETRSEFLRVHVGRVA